MSVSAASGALIASLITSMAWACDPATGAGCDTGDTGMSEVESFLDSMDVLTTGTPTTRTMPLWLKERPRDDGQLFEGLSRVYELPSAGGTGDQIGAARVAGR